jgi:L-seryl-tRNA(Ser) seleniumtransferase
MSKQLKKGSSPLRQLPSVDQLLKSLPVEDTSSVGIARSTLYARRVVQSMRADLQTNGGTQTVTREDLLSEAQSRWRQMNKSDRGRSLQRVINATGVILHTNLGRAPLSEEACKAIADASGYCTLEYDLDTGARGIRGGRVDELLKQLTGAEDALVVNNCASAALLVLTALAHDGETIVSRGELVEIGGDFRVPDVLANSGTKMVEVGTTNRTRIDDYRRAFTESTRLVMRIHPSNYRIIGFTASPSLSELVAFAQGADLPLYEDAGSGVLADLSQYGLEGEPIIHESIAAGADVVSFSGDKLLGSAQAGLLVGRKEIISKLRKHSLYRALRPDKLCLAALEATLEAHARGTATTDVPAMRMIATSAEEISVRAAKLLESLRAQRKSEALLSAMIEGESAIGGGSGPNTHPQTVLISLTHDRISAGDMERHLRKISPPVIGRIADDRLLLDLRTVAPEDDSHILKALIELNSLV